MKGLIGVAAAMAAAVVALGGCGGSSTPATTSSATTATTAPSTTASSAPATSSASTSGPSSTAANTTSTSSAPPTTVGPCTAADFTAALTGPGNGAAGTIYYTVSATNVTPSPCVTGGYFGVSTYDVAGHVISSQDERSPLTPLTRFTVPPRGSLTFTVGLSDVPSGQGQCPQVGALHLIPPNDTRYVQLSLLDAGGQGRQVVNCPGNLVVTAAAAS